MRVLSQRAQSLPVPRLCASDMTQCPNAAALYPLLISAQAVVHPPNLEVLREQVLEPALNVTHYLRPPLLHPLHIEHTAHRRRIHNPQSTHSSDAASTAHRRSVTTHKTCPRTVRCALVRVARFAFEAAHQLCYALRFLRSAMTGSSASASCTRGACASRLSARLSTDNP